MKTTAAALSLLAATGANAQALEGLGMSVEGLLSSLAPASPDDERFKNFQPPSPNDIRGPCPGLNALANHNFLHHDGRNMNIPHLLQGLSAGLNMGPDFTVAIGGAGLLAASDPETGAFSLSDIAQHNFPIEHDSSLSRQDAFFGDQTPFFQPSWDQVLDVIGREGQTSLQTATDAKFARYNDSMTRNPEFVYSLREFIFTYGETAIYLQSMGSPTAGGVVDIEYVRALFEEERLPYEEGWRRSDTPVSLLSLGAQVLELYSAGPEPIPEGAQIFEDSYKDLLIAAAGGSAALGRLTEGISEALGL